MRPVIVLVIILGRPKMFGWTEFGHDGPVVQSAHFEIPHHLGRCLFLLLEVIENRGPVLGAFVVALPVPRGRVVNREEDRQYFPERCGSRVER